MKNRILIVDDAYINRELLKEMLSENYEILEAENGKEALDIVENEKHINGILLDLVMPVMDGFELLEELKKTDIMDKIPVMIISSEMTAQNENRCFNYGVFDFIGRPFKLQIVQKRVENMIKIYDYKNHLEDRVRAQTEVLRKANEKLKKRNKDIMDMLGTIVEFRNLESGEHIKRVKEYTRVLAEYFSVKYPEYDLTRDKINNIVEASALHDLGKVCIPDRILLKPGKLTDEEFAYMKTHTTRGCELLNSVNIDWNEELIKTCYEIIRHHHEKYDGNGYPDGLKGDEILISAQLVSLADVYDALINERCYKAAFSKEEAYNMIINGKCGQFSPKLLEAFEHVREQFENFDEKKQRVTINSYPDIKG